MKSNRVIEIDAETARILSRIAEAGDDLASILKAFPVDPTEFAEFLEEIGESDTEAAQMIIQALPDGSDQETEVTPDGASNSFVQKVSGSGGGMLRPLSKRSLAGKPYHRSEIIEAQIRHALSLSRSQFIARAKTSDHNARPYFQAECLVYMIREYRHLRSPRFYKAADELEGILLDHCAPFIQGRVKKLNVYMYTVDAGRDVIEILHRAINDLSEKSDFLEVSFYTYLRLRCSDACRKYRRHMKDQAPLEALAGYGQPDEEVVAQHDPSAQWDGPLPSPADLYQTEEEKAMVWRAIDTLSEREKTAIVLHYFRDWPIHSKDPMVPTLCRRFDLSDSTMRRVLRKAKQKIATWLNDHGKPITIPRRDDVLDEYAMAGPSHARLQEWIRVYPLFQENLMMLTSDWEMSEWRENREALEHATKEDLAVQRRLAEYGHKLI